MYTLINLSDQINQDEEVTSMKNHSIYLLRGCEIREDGRKFSMLKWLVTSQGLFNTVLSLGLSKAQIFSLLYLIILDSAYSLLIWLMRMIII